MTDTEWEAKSPAFQLYVRDVLTDLDFLRCTWAAQGIWFRCLCLMWLAPTRGKLEALDRAELCRMIGGAEVEISPLIDELIRNRVASSDASGVLINRRMFRQAKLKQTRSESGSKGGKTRVANLQQEQDVAEFAQAKPQAKPQAKIKQKCLPASASASASTSTSSDPTNSVPSPLVEGCVWFRMSESERALVEAYYRKNKFPPELLGFAISEVEGWMARGAKAGARAARKAPTHYLQTYAAWVIDNAMTLLRAQGRNGSASRFAAERPLTVTEHNAKFFREKAEQLKGNNSHGHQRANDEVIDVTQYVVPNPKGD